MLFLCTNSIYKNVFKKIISILSHQAISDPLKHLKLIKLKVYNNDNRVLLDIINACIAFHFYF